MYSKQEIQKRLNELKNEENIIKKYYHFKSIQNFITFFDDLGDSESKEKVFSTLMEYLERVKFDPIENLEQCTIVFNEYIRPVGNLYERYLGFMPLLRLWVLLFWSIFLIGLLRIINVPLIFLFVVGLFFMCYYIYIIKKRFEKRVYGLAW